MDNAAAIYRNSLSTLNFLLVSTKNNMLFVQKLDQNLFPV